MAKAKKNELEKVESTAVVAPSINFGADAGMGMEGTTADSFAIPFLAVIQTNSPYVLDGDMKYIPAAKAGMFINTVTEKLYEGKERGVLFVPAAYKRAFLHWGPRTGEGQGFKGEYAPEIVAAMRAERKVVEFEGKLFEPLSDGSVNPKRCNRFSDTRMHYGMLLDEDTGEFNPVLLSLTSTQIKKSKQLMTMLQQVKVDLPDGTKVTPPTFANVVRLHTVPESNDQGNWFGVRFTIDSLVTDSNLYSAARAFNESVRRGAVTANFAETTDSAEGTGNGF